MEASSLQLASIEIDAAAVLLDHGRHGDVGPLVGGEATLAGHALPPPPDEVPVLGHPGLDHLGLVLAAEGAFHDRGS